MDDSNNLVPKRDKKLHEIYIKKFGNKDLHIVKGFEIESTRYQLKLADLSLKKIKVEIEKKEKKIIICVNGCVITHFGKLTKEELTEKYCNRPKRLPPSRRRKIKE